MAIEKIEPAIKRGGKRIGSGRRKGVPNRVTSDARAAIAAFAGANASNLGKWLAEVQDPARRIDLYLRVLEYHIPKIARTEVTGVNGGPQQHTYRWLDASGET
jgi:hypothetical protein